VEVEELKVQLIVDDFVARVKMEQLFVNRGGAAATGRVVFPLPKGAAVASFATIVDGKRILAEVAEKAAARRAFQQLVAQRKQPALLEYLSGDIFQASVGTVPAGESRLVELVFEYPLKAAGGLYEWVLPLKAGASTYRTIPQFSLDAKLKTSFPLQGLYSPSHQVEVTRKGPQEARVRFSRKAMDLKQDLKLFFSASDRDYGVSLMTHRLPPEDGYFMLMINPPADAEVQQVARDVSIVLDVSGSMRGEKLAQAKKAVKYVVSRLGDEDRFEVLAFSSTVKRLTGAKLWPADDAHEQKAAQALARTRARGGTNVHASLIQALKSRQPNRPHIVVFLTDGEPTEGETDTVDIHHDVKEANDGSRVFVVGVGYDLDVKLLDGLSQQNRGASVYIEPDQQIDEEMARWFARISTPVLTDLAIDFGDAGTELVYPDTLPDLFAGEQLLLVGRYTQPGDHLVTLKGRSSAGVQEHLFDLSFPEQQTRRDFLPRLWAKRRVGYLLDRIRLLGERKELKDEVVTLAKEYSIATPYTSFLVRGPAEMRSAMGQPIPKDQQGRIRSAFIKNKRLRSLARDLKARYKGGSGASRGVASAGGRAPLSTQVQSYSRKPTRFRPSPIGRKLAPATAAEPEPADAFGGDMDALGDMEEGLSDDLDDGPGYGSGSGGGGFADEMAFADAAPPPAAAPEAARLDLNATSGEAAVNAAKKLAELKESDVAGAAAPRSDGAKQAGGKVFRQQGEVWIDEAYDAGAKLDEVGVKFGSDAYFNLLGEIPELAQWLSVGEQVVVVVRGKVLRVGETGKEDLTAEEVAALFPAP
jgi:Ca-activated chloride channel family protein